MKEGFYSIAFAGKAGAGFGMLVLDTGSVVGADAGGASYDGTYAFNQATGMVDIDVVMAAPPGVWPVQTGAPLTAPLRLPFKVSLPRDLGAEKPMRIDVPSLGPVNIVFRKVRGFPS